MTLSWPVIAKHAGDRKAKNDSFNWQNLRFILQKITSKLDEKAEDYNDLKDLSTEF